MQKYQMDKKTLELHGVLPRFHQETRVDYSFITSVVSSVVSADEYSPKYL